MGVPVIHIYGGVKGADKIKKTYDAFQKLENDYVEKIASSLTGKAKERFLKNMRKLGVNDSKKDYDAMGSPYVKGNVGHHKRDVSRNPENATDPRYIQKESDSASHLRSHQGDYRNAPRDGSMNPAYD